MATAFPSSLSSLLLSLADPGVLRQLLVNQYLPEKRIELIQLEKKRGLIMCRMPLKVPK